MEKKENLQTGVGVVELTIPLRITVSLGAPAVAAQGFPAPQPAVAARGLAASADELDLEVIRIDPDYSNRGGYDPDFLDVTVPLPELTQEQRKNAAVNSQPRPGDDPTLLRYHHFSLVIHRKRRMAFYTACNIDGARMIKVLRKEFESDRDKWSPDPRIPVLEQTGERHYRHRRIDRGHLVRREDPNWGASFDEAKRANDDTFHFTNCTPQHSEFNQRSVHWQGMENFILKEAKAARHRVTVFTGPVFEQGDPELDGVQVPLAFWKIVVFGRADGTLSASAYVLEQAGVIGDILEAVFDAGEFQVPISEVIGRTGLDFRHLIEHDSLAGDGDGDDGSHEVWVEGHEMAPKATPARVPLTSFDDVRL